MDGSADCFIGGPVPFVKCGLKLSIVTHLSNHKNIKKESRKDVLYASI